ncbi:hypothetical protein FV139_17175 [Parahaliea maris]|uniref:Uncharacterized protein n=1 Tax=Parahaliea maris TaxID=2716870 RepID=A0A5C8ZT12_9GAMM|nr:hypothetical protein [Parahaliea maris]TXS90712.1 hypothetical protein FV139_17175 [Parahaliea maris]
MNKFLKIALGLVCFIGLVIGAVFFFTAGMVETADEFFAAVKRDDMKAAYSYLSEDFQASTSEAELAAYLAKNRLNQVSEASWGARSVESGRGNLKGSITTDAGGVVPVTLGFVKGDEGWRIYTIQKPASGIQQESGGPQVPGEEELVRLVDGSVQVFVQSVQERSMETFYDHVSRLWQDQFTVDKFDEAYAPFYAMDVDFSLLRTVSPVFTSAPTIDENGVLEISGYYPTQPQQFQFRQNYIYEGLSWKLVGLYASIQ